MQKTLQKKIKMWTEMRSDGENYFCNSTGNTR